MSIGLYPEAGRGEPQRVKDNGSGVKTEVLAVEESFGTKFYKVRTTDGNGWVAEHLIVLDDAD